MEEVVATVNRSVHNYYLANDVVLDKLFHVPDGTEPVCLDP